MNGTKVPVREMEFIDRIEETRNRGTLNHFAHVRSEGLLDLCALNSASAFFAGILNFRGVTLRYFDRLQPVALLVLRIVLGVIMIGHGYPKVHGGGFLEHWHRVQSLGLPGFLAIPSALAELVGGILVLLGLFTRFAAGAILIDMLVAIWKVHWKNGLLAQHGYEFPLSLAAMALALACYGAGPLALELIRRGGKSSS